MLRNHGQHLNCPARFGSRVSRLESRILILEFLLIVRFGSRAGPAARVFALRRVWYPCCPPSPAPARLSHHLSGLVCQRRPRLPQLGLVMTTVEHLRLQDPSLTASLLLGTSQRLIPWTGSCIFTLSNETLHKVRCDHAEALGTATWSHGST
ncbi:uncharacterized protein EKO05_0001250 [Ascochyta rabiei]|uniref:uncharacterized protein n=1 Tax=Didymella rabiei TaxID=5454 RepID=UPI00220FCDDB|nr:uncharacterized protein EKO05_0001250 [Ascochyta rabiei]UPX10601.1 hypothetical protein EKO05_0001250 [Ascochyta rabiei]